MKTINLFFILSFLKEIFTNTNDYYSFQQSPVNPADLMENLNLTNNLNIILGYLYVSDDNPCINNIILNYRNKSEKIEKIYEGSSKGFVDTNSFLSCINDEENTFFSIYPNWTNENRLDIARLDKNNLKEHLWIFGICLKDQICNENDIKEIFGKVNDLFGRPFHLYTKDNIIVDDFKLKKEDKTSTKNVIIFFIPAYFFIIQIIFLIFKIIPVKLFSCCLRRKYLREANKNISTNELDSIINTASLTKQITFKIRKCFSVSEIVDDLIYSKKNELFKDEDLTYIKGIKTLGIFFFVFGFSFTILYNYPLCLSDVEKRESYLTDTRAGILMICFRLSPALFLSASGYSLSYKFLNFLDKKLMNITLDSSEKNNKDNKDINANPEKNDNNNQTELSEDKDKNINEIVEKMEENKQIKDNSNSVETSSDVSKSYYENTFGIKFYSEDASKKALNQIFQGQRINEKGILSEISTEKIPYNMYLNFILRQWHKLVLLALGMLIVRLSLPVLLLLTGNTPLLYYIYINYFEKLGDSFQNYLYYGNFVDLFADTDGFLMMQLFCIPMSEINYFIICTILIFLSYKKKWRLDIILAILIFAFILFKFIYVLNDLDTRNPGMFYTDTKFQRFFFNPLFNFDFYLIGMLFGMVNYVVQNGITNKESTIKQRPFVKIPISLSKLCDYHRIQRGQKNNNFIHFIFIVILLLFSFLISPILFSQNFDDIIKKNNPSKFFTIMSLIDIELFIYCFHFFAMSCYVTGQNIFFEILNANISSYGAKLGIWIVLGTPTLTYLIVYSNEANINLSFFMVIVYGSITLINGVILSVLYFLFMEMPYKKLVKLYFNITAELNKVYLEDVEGGNNEDDNELNALSEKDLLGDIMTNNTKEEDDEDDVIKDD